MSHSLLLRIQFNVKNQNLSLERERNKIRSEKIDHAAPKVWFCGCWFLVISSTLILALEFKILYVNGDKSGKFFTGLDSTISLYQHSTDLSFFPALSLLPHSRSRDDFKREKLLSFKNSNKLCHWRILWSLSSNYYLKICDLPSQLDL